MELAIITPAYSKHLALLELSAESVDRFCPVEFLHYILISSRDYPVFRHFDGARRWVIIAEDVLPGQRFVCFGCSRVDRYGCWTGTRRYPAGKGVPVPGTVHSSTRLSRTTLSEASGRMKKTSVSDHAADAQAVRPRDRPRGHLLEPPTKRVGIERRRRCSVCRRATTVGDAGANCRRQRCSLVQKCRALRRFGGIPTLRSFVQELLGDRDMRHLRSDEELCIAWRFIEGARDPEDRRQRLTERLWPSDVAVNIQSNLHLPLTEVRQLIDTALACAERGPAADGVRRQ